jgi:single-strand DNA-binding protein
MNIAIIRGSLSRDPELRELPSGSTVANYEVTVRELSPAESVPVAWPDPPPTWQRMVQGDEVVVSGRIRRRYFRTAGGTQSRTELVAERVVPVSQGRRVRGLLDKAASSIQAVSG